MFTTLSIAGLGRVMTVLIFCFSMVIISFGYSDIAVAAKKTEQKKKNKAPLIRKKTYDRLIKAQELAEAKKYKEAAAVLDQIKGMRKLNSTETAQLWNFYAFIYFSQDKYPQAIKAYKKLLEQPNLPEGLKASTLYTLSQLYFVTEDYKKALSTVKEWMAMTEAPSPDAYALLGQAYYKLNQFKQAISPLKKAIALQKEKGKKVKENWYLLLRVNYYELKDYKNMVVVLTELVSLYPKKQYLQDLAGAYSQMGETKKQLGIMEAMYDKGYLTSESQLKNLASLFLMHGVPYKAAKVLEKASKEGSITENKQTLGLLSQAWMQAREDSKAVSPLRKAAALANNGTPWVRLGQVYANLDRWKEAAEAFRLGLKKGGLKRKGSANIMLGMSYYNMKMLTKAKSAFIAASRSGSERNKKAASQWVTYIDTEMERMESLAQN